MQRRTFLKQTATTAAATLLGLDSAEKLLANAPPATGDDGNTKSGPALSLPKGGGAIKGIGETFKPNPFTGTGNFSVPIAVSPGRGGMTPQLGLQYSTGSGNGPFGLGWSLSVPMISRKTEKGIPLYNDALDTFVLSGAEDLVPTLNKETGQHETGTDTTNTWDVYRYRPRVEGLHARIEFWRAKTPNQEAEKTPMNKAVRSFWMITTKDNVVNIYGYTPNARLNMPDDPDKTFEWRLEVTYDAKSNFIFYQYKPDEGLVSKKNATKTPGDDPTPKIPIFEAHRYPKDGKKQVYQTYLSAINYGNLTQLILDGFTANIKTLGEVIEKGFGPGQFMFTVRFDYGEFGRLYKTNDGQETPHHFIEGAVFDQGTGQWHNRPDPFSSYRAGFEIRTYRRCQRILMFHNGLGRPGNLLVRSTDLHYTENEYNGMSMLTRVVQRGYRLTGTALLQQSEELDIADCFTKKQEDDIQQCIGSGVLSDNFAIQSLPPLMFRYSEFKPKKQRFETVTADGGDIVGEPLSNPNLALVDLHGTGLSDLLLTADTGYYYWQNKGAGRFSHRRTMKQMPNNVQLNGAGVSFGDMGGDGQPDLLVHEGSQWGFYESNGNAGWQNFVPYKKQPTFDLNDGRSRLMDLTGDGKIDLLRSDENYFYYFPCAGESGWESPKRVKRKHSLPDFPDVDFSNPRVKLADMTGDGLQDIVLVHDGRIDYWANLGYGRFSKRVTLKNAPRFGFGFDPKRLLFADIDGSGTADMIYLESNRVRVWFNQSGNIWSEELTINGTPNVTDMDTMQAADLYGCGCQGLLWSAVYGHNTGSNYRFMDFTGGVKPNLLTEVDDNMGVTTRVAYKPSTHFYLEDKQKGREWVTALPFPVHCLERVEHIDHVSKTKMVTRYAYHHGYYDGREREFRGFAFVEQWDTEAIEVFEQQTLHGKVEFSNAEKGFHVPPIYTKTWYHTGAYPTEKVRETYQAWNSNPAKAAFNLHELFQKDFYRGNEVTFKIAPSLFERADWGFTQQGVPEAYRALQGQVLRQEVYGLDGSEAAKHPYTVSETAVTIRQLQAQATNQHAVFQVIPLETLSYHYERKPLDPRIGQEITLETDAYGQVLESVSLAYPRMAPDQKEQGCADPERNDPQWHFYGTYTRNKIENLENTHWRRIGVLTETQTFQLPLSNFAQQPLQKITAADIRQIIGPKEGQSLELKCLNWSLNFYKRKEDADKYVGIAQQHIDEVLLPLQQVQVAFSQDLAETIYQEAGAGRDMMLKAAGYISLSLGESRREYWCIPSGQQSLNVNQFYLPVAEKNPFGQESKISYEQYGLLMTELTDPLGNTIKAKNDYFALQPSEITDANGVISRVAFDALGAVVASGTVGVEGEGDPLLEFQVPYSYKVRMALTDYYREEGDKRPLDIMRDAASVVLYDLWRGIHLKLRNKTCYTDQPQAVLSLIREEHHSVNKTPKIQTKITYFDGLDREIQTKIQTEPDAQGNARYITSGWKIYNNKGKPVRQFEPFYTNKPYYESIQDFYDAADKSDLMGCSSVLFYDPLERQVCTLHANHTYEKVVFDAWHQITYDVNDTVSGNPFLDEDIKGLVKDFEPRFCFGDQASSAVDYKTWAQEKGVESRAVKLTTRHQNTPSTAYLDILGRVYETVQLHTIDGKSVEKHITTHELDIQGNILSITDPRCIKCFRYQYDMLKRPLVVDSKDAGRKTMLPDIFGQPVWTKDANGNETITEYDALRRPTEVWVKQSGKADFCLLGATVYGETKAEGVRKGLFGLKKGKIAPYFKGKVWKVYDGAGKVENLAFDFKGNVLETQRTLLLDNKAIAPEWSLKCIGNPFQEDKTDLIESGLDPALSFVTKSTFDAPNRVISVTLPDGTVQKPTYTPANLLQSVTVNDDVFVKTITYNAKGQREKIVYGNGVTTTYTYEKETYRLLQLRSLRNNSTVLQDLNYIYDPVGNILEIRDEALKTVWCNNDKIDGVSQYQYDSLYRLIFATGREHEANTAQDNPAAQRFKKAHCIPLPQNPSNALAIRYYTETYAYDKSGNFTLRKRAVGRYAEYVADMPGATLNRKQDYADNSNRILKTGDQTLAHDANGNLLNLLGENSMAWDYRNQLVKVKVQAQAGKDKFAYYQYDAQGNRVRKYNAQTQEERIYLGGYECYYKNGEKTLESFHILDGKSRIAMIEQPLSSAKVVQYQLSNHLGSATLELDESLDAHIISYEEYYAYGGTAYFAQCEDGYSFKRYRYSGKERDEESGLYYYGARYYAPWMGRWGSCDPLGEKMGLNIYLFAKGNPIKIIDIFGLGDAEDLVNNLKQTGADMAQDAKKMAASTLNGFVSYGKNILESVSHGEYSEAVAKAIGVDHLAESYEKYTSGGASTGESAALMLGDVIGTNDLMQAYTGENMQGSQLSDVEISRLAVSGGVKLATTSIATAGGGQILKGGNLKVNTGAFNSQLESNGFNGLGKLANMEVKVSEKGLNLVKEHLKKFGDIPINNEMVKRLENALSKGQSIKSADASFYMHELSEQSLMSKFGISQETSHGMSLQKYEVSPFSVYHPEALNAVEGGSFNKGFFDFWNIPYKGL